MFFLLYGNLSVFGQAPIAGFAYQQGVDTVWINSPYTFVNTSTNILPTANNSYWSASHLANPGACLPGLPVPGCYHSRSYNFTTQFSQAGFYTVKLLVTNGSGQDEITKTIYVDTPSRKPIADFYFSKNLVGLNDKVEAYDISQNGPTQWKWSINPVCYNCTDPDQIFNSFESPNLPGIPNDAIPYPNFSAKEAGEYEICLKVWNDRGMDSICKPKYVKVSYGTLICGSAGNQMEIETHAEGFLYDYAGPNGTFGGGIYNGQFNCNGSGFGQGRNGILINPCATSITLSVEQFRLRNNNADQLIIRDGGPNGPDLYSRKMNSIGNHLLTVTATTGRAWVNFITANSAGGDSGFTIRWTSVPAVFPPPISNFTMPDTIYAGYPVSFINKSTGSGDLTFDWDSDGDGVYDSKDVSINNKVFNTLAPIVRQIKLLATNCRGNNEMVKPLVILPVTQPPTANFYAESAEGFASDAFKFHSTSTNGAIGWNWSFFVGNSEVPATVVYQSGTNQFSENPIVKFTAKGQYTVRLVAANGLGNDVMTKVNYINVLAYSSPYSNGTIPGIYDIGITQVTIGTVDKTSALNSPIYENFSATSIATLYRGVKYTVTARRPTAVTAMTRRIWLDKDLDGEFYSPGETLASEDNTKTLSLSADFYIPNNIEPGRLSRLRVGAGLGSGELTPESGNPGCFEDYGIEIGLNDSVPSLVLNGPSPYRVEVNKPYVEPGGVALDDLEGDISDRIQLIEGSVNTSKVGYYTLKYSVADLYGNVSAIATRIVQVELNQTGPSITLNGNDTMYLEVFDPYAEPGATAKDNTGADITNKLVVTGSVNVSRIDSYWVTYTVTDAFNFTSTKKRLVVVRDTQAPEISTTYGSNFIKHQVGTLFTDAQIIFKDNYYPLNQITWTREGNVDHNAVRQQMLKYKASDPSGNTSAEYVVWVDVRDTIKPNVSLKGTNPLLVDVYAKKIDDPGIEYSDNYYDKAALLVTPIINVNVNQLGVNYNITYVVKDPGGNETRIVRDVQVVDREKPTIEPFGSNPFAMRRYDDYIEPGVYIRDNYNTDTELQPKLITTTTLDKRPGTGAWFASTSGWKRVVYVVTDNAGNTSDEFVRLIEVAAEPTSVAEHNAESGISVYPNPASDKLFISLKDLIVGGKINVTVFNILGEKVSQQTLVTADNNGTVLNVSELKEGVYMVKLSYNNREALYKINVVR